MGLREAGGWASSVSLLLVSKKTEKQQEEKKRKEVLGIELGHEVIFLGLAKMSTVHEKYERQECKSYIRTHLNLIQMV